MITLEQYVGRWADSPDWTPARQANAARLLIAVQKLEDMMLLVGVRFPINAATGSGISGRDFGGFRPQNCPQGAAHSAHKEGLAVDRYDPKGEIDAWLLENQYALAECGIYIESPDHTPGWSHWSISPPRSGRHIFIP